MLRPEIKMSRSKYSKRTSMMGSSFVHTQQKAGFSARYEQNAPEGGHILVVSRHLRLEGQRSESYTSRHVATMCARRRSDCVPE